MIEGRPTRRRVLQGGATAAVCLAMRPAAAADERADAIRAFAGEAEIRRGRVTLDLPPLVENGNSALLTVTVDSAMSDSDFVRRIAVFNARNPQPNVFTAQLGRGFGRAAIATRIRLATSQQITAVAEMGDGTYWSDSADVIVTLAACVEG